MRTLAVSDTVSERQMKAVEAMLSFSKAPITDSRVRFSGPESSVEMELVKGSTHNWSHTGTNGFTSKWSAGSK